MPLVRNMAGTITDCANIFNHSPKRQRCLEKVISLDQLESQRTKIRDLCSTRWVERHEAYETFVQLLSSVVKTFEVILGEQQHLSLTVTMKILAVIKLISVKL